MDLKQELAVYSAIPLEKLESEGNQLPDRIRNSIVLYNKALESLKSGSEDIAIIELKKAVALNPEFNEAYNLLGLCYVYIKDPVKAAEAFARVATAEKNGVQALKYLEAMQAGEVQLSSGLGKKRPSKAAETSSAVRDAVVGLKRNGKADIVRYVLGAVVGIMIGLMVGYMLRGQTADETDPITQIPDTTVHETTTQPDTNPSVSDEVLKLQAMLKTANEQNEYYGKLFQLQEAGQLYQSRSYEKAADILIALKDFKFKDNDQTTYNNLAKKLFPKAMRAMLDETYGLYSSKKYRDAVVRITKLAAYDNSWVNMDEALYLLGKCYVNLNDTRSAIETFQKVVNQYSQGGYAARAQNRLKELGSNP